MKEGRWREHDDPHLMRAKEPSGYASLLQTYSQCQSPLKLGFPQVSL